MSSSSAVGRSSPSFLIGVSVLVIAVVGYAAWSYLRPSQHAQSEQLVRQFARTVGKEVNAFRRHSRKVTRAEYDGPEEVSAAVATLEKSAEEALERIEEYADEARDELVTLDIAIGTQRNRNRRLDTREEEARAEVTGLAAEAKATLQGN